MNFLFAMLFSAVLAVPAAAAEATPLIPTIDLKVVGDWAVQVVVPAAGGASSKEFKATLNVPPPETLVVTSERYASLPLFDPKPHPFGWNRGAALAGLKAAGCTTRHALDPASVVVRAAKGTDVPAYERGKDYEMDDVCGAVGRLPGSRIATDQAVFISYHYVKLRIDSIVRSTEGKPILRVGEPHVATPLPPALGPGEVRLANLWLPGRPLKRLNEDCLFPILETAYPEPPQTSPTVAEHLLPKTMQKLQQGRPVKILAWGDSVTECGWLSDGQRWQDQFVVRLSRRFPAAKIELIHQGWGGKNTELFLNAPPGNPHNYREHILGSRPDLIISEFINDVPLSQPQVEIRYGRLLEDFRAIGAEWIILTPHYSSPDGMGFTRERQIDDDPRPYVAALREFAARRQVALADASLRYGRMWRQGLPYSTLLSNTINHPDPRGMTLFADSLMALFP